MKLFFLILFLFLSVGVISVSAYGWSLLQPVDTRSTEKTDFVITKGASFSDVALQLQQQGIIKSAFALRMITKLESKNVVIHPGTFSVSKSMNASEIINALLTEPEDIWVTLLEGWRMEEIAEELAQNLPNAFDKQEFMRLAKEKEGRLFPDTYLFPKEATAQFVLSTLENTFKKRYESVIAETGKTTRLEDEIIIIASLLEREAREPAEMKVVAGVFENRLKLGMPLQVDATLQYAKGYDSTLQTWWAEPKAIDKQVDSPYNTYKKPGLPPGPISNPGKSALIAAAKPDTTDYLFYISDRQGNMHYAVTLDQHNANITKYLR